MSKLSVHTGKLTASTSEAAAALAGLTHLEEVRLHPGSRRRFATRLGGLPRLTNLSIHADAVTDRGLAQLARARMVHTLLLTTPSVTDAGLAALAGADLPDLNTLVINLPGVTDGGIAHMVRLTGLKVLHITAPKTTPAGLRRLTELSGLTVLDLSGTPVDDDLVTSLASLTELSSLGVSDADAQVSETAYLRLRSARPAIKINSVWIGPEVVQQALGSAMS